MKRYLPAIIFAVALPALADNSSDDNVREIFNSHKGIIQELAKDYVEGQQVNDPDLPGQKNRLLKMKIVTKKTNEQQAAPPPVKYTFSAKTVWANVTVHVTDYHNHYNLGIESDTPIDGWVVKKGQNVVLKGGENEAYNFAFDVNDVYTQDCTLTVMAMKDGMINPALVPLRNGGTQ